MIIKYLGREKFELKSKDNKIDLGYKVAVNGFIFSGPGEYEKNGVFVEGIADNGNTIFVVRAEDMKLCFLGNIAHELKENEAKEIGDIDILFVPLGEDSSLNTKQASKIISQIDPRIVIPMLYTNLDEFKKLEGITDGETDILKVKKNELPEDQRKNVILRVA
jgi:L-ascorbate metabolism protein UlaG (beta-lactamase superfamily)